MTILATNNDIIIMSDISNYKVYTKEYDNNRFQICLSDGEPLGECYLGIYSSYEVANSVKLDLYDAIVRGNGSFNMPRI